MHQETKAAMDSTIVGAKAGYEKAKNEILAVIDERLRLEVLYHKPGFFTDCQWLLKDIIKDIQRLELKEQG